MHVASESAKLKLGEKEKGVEPTADTTGEASTTLSDSVRSKEEFGVYPYLDETELTKLVKCLFAESPKRTKTVFSLHFHLLLLKKKVWLFFKRD